MLWGTRGDIRVCAISGVLVRRCLKHPDENQSTRTCQELLDCLCQTIDLMLQIDGGCLTFV